MKTKKIEYLAKCLWLVYLVLIILGSTIEPKFFSIIASVALVPVVVISGILMKNKMGGFLLKILALYSLVLYLFSGTGNTLLFWSTGIQEVEEMMEIMGIFVGVLALLGFAPVIALCIGVFFDVRKPKKAIEVFLEILAAYSLFISSLLIKSHFEVASHPMVEVTLSQVMSVWVMYAPVIVMGILILAYLKKLYLSQEN
jgi:hypothetical protein